MSHDPLAELDVGPEPEAEVPVDQATACSPEAEQADTATAGIVPLGDSLTIVEAAEVGARLTGVFDSGAPVILDGADLEQVDGAGVQLLAALMKEAAERQVEISWRGSAPVVAEAAAQLGLSDLLRLDTEQGAAG